MLTSVQLNKKIKGRRQKTQPKHRMYPPSAPLAKDSQGATLVTCRTYVVCFLWVFF